MAQTENLKLYVTPTSDTTTKMMDWVQEMAASNIESNMVKIDAAYASLQQASTTQKANISALTDRTQALENTANDLRVDITGVQDTTGDLQLRMATAEGNITILQTTSENKAPAGFGIGTIAKNISGSVLTEILKNAQSGFYKGNNVDGAPSTAWYYFKIISDSQTYAIVIAYGFDGNLWRSAYRGGVLGSWVKIYDQSNKPTPSEIGAVAKNPSLSDSEKYALKNLAIDYFYANNNNGTEDTDDDYSNFIYDGNASPNVYTDISKAYTTDTNGRKRIKINCQLLCQLIWMGVNPSKFVGHQTDYEPSFGENDLAFDWGYKPKYYKHEKAYGLFKRVPKDADAGFVGDEFYGFKKPYDDTYESSYSNNSYYSDEASEKFALVVDGNVTSEEYTNTAHQMLKGYCWEGDLAEELYAMGCEVDYSDIEVGDLIFSSVSVVNDSTSLYHQQSFRNISHVAVVYEVDKGNNIIKVIEATSLENKPIIKNSLSFGGNYDITRAANNLTNIAMVARHPHAFGISNGIGDAFAKMKTPDNRLEPIGWGSNSKQKKYKNTVILTAPNGGKYKLSVNDEGTLTTVPMLNDYSE